MRTAGAGDAAAACWRRTACTGRRCWRCAPVHAKAPAAATPDRPTTGPAGDRAARRLTGRPGAGCGLGRRGAGDAGVGADRARMPPSGVASTARPSLRGVVRRRRPVAEPLRGAAAAAAEQLVAGRRRVLARGRQRRGVVLRTALLRAVHEARVQGLHRAAAAGGGSPPRLQRPAPASRSSGSAS